MKILVLNSGSSSIKFRLFSVSDGDWQVAASGAVTRLGEEGASVRLSWSDASGEARAREEAAEIGSHHAGIERIVASLQDTGALGGIDELGAVGHRVVHGGEAFHAPTLVDDDVIAAIRQMIPLAPLHNPANLDGILVARELFPGVPQVAVFDTAFHQTMPRTAYRYAIPGYLYREHHVRRYGFHGTSHHYVAKAAARRLGKPLSQCNLITLHLGNGASATAIRDGASVDTSMGMTPLEGLVMGSRCGDIDPAVHFYLCRHLGFDNDTLDDLLNRQSGLVGLCGVNDMREVHRLAEAGNEDAELALGVTCHRLRKYIGAYAAVLGHVDALVFTGGIGENDAEVRRCACADLTQLGIALDAEANARAQGSLEVISSADSRVAVLVVPTDEELEIGRQALEAIDRS
ncbi:acetate kinase [Thiohalocapsa halophila]|uniref:Acetate kinase n=1 Tax=Thiohalocapsa halophila TaxID=69359 RepID=A0ABS1CGE2_9GAMM|nr:acetate kinase [Thiohalocapsa halophila]MBK1630963.1 acetate kinase [Thiohalocapsa halophila]